MERTICDFTLDLSRSYSPVTVKVKRGDTHRTLRIHLADGGRPYRIGAGCTAVFTGIKPDGSHLYNACRLEGDMILYDLTPQTTVLVGELECELRLYGEDEALLTTAAFVLSVADTVYADGDEGIVSTGEATALTKLISDANQKIAEMEAVLANEVNHAVIDDSTLGADAWSSKNIVDKLCPGFTEEGPAVRCEPVADFPLAVVSTLKPQDSYKTITLKHCGKNILDIATAGVYHPNPAASSYLGMKVTETGLRMELVKDSMNNWGVCGFCLGTVKELAGKTITVSGKVKTAFTDVQLPWLNISATNAEPTTVRENPVYTDGGNVNARKTLAASNGHSGHAVATYTVTGEEEYAYIAIVFQFTYGGSGVTGDWTQWSDIQVEIGDTATAYEPYKGQTFTADLTKAPSMIEGASYNWNTGLLYTGESEYWHNPATGNFYDTAESEACINRKITAFPGTNTLYSDCGDTQVKGKADPVKIIEKLTNAILAQGGTV